MVFLGLSNSTRKGWWKKPLKHKKKNASWLLWELCYWTEFTFTAMLWRRHLKVKMAMEMKRF